MFTTPQIFFWKQNTSAFSKCEKFSKQWHNFAELFFTVHESTFHKNNFIKISDVAFSNSSIRGFCFGFVFAKLYFLPFPGILQYFQF